jgi:hypothetical protein
MDEYLLQSSTPGEATIDAAPWRLDEEMGIICPLSFSFSMSYHAEVSNGLIANEIVRVFAGRFNGTPIPDSLEVRIGAGNPLARSGRTSTRGPTSTPFGSERSGMNFGVTSSDRFTAPLRSRKTASPDTRPSYDRNI